MADFGSNPLFYTEEAGTYTLVATSPETDTIGLTPNWPADRHEIMQSRAAAYGYVLTKQDGAAASSSDKKGKNG